MHGPTFMANPLACAVALASVRLLLSQPWQQKALHVGEILSEELAHMKNRPWVCDVRVLGAIGVVELDRDVDLARFQRLCVREGVWIRPFGHNAYIMPPFMVVSDDQVRKLARAMCSILDEMYGNNPEKP